MASQDTTVPNLPPRPAQGEVIEDKDHLGVSQFQPPPQRVSLEQNDATSPIYYARDPKKLVGYLVPFPRPNLHNIPSDRVPPRFLIYTPPPPPLVKPAEGEKEGKVHKVQRKWQEEVRAAKTSDAKTMSWKGVKGKATKAISWGINHTTTSSLDFLTRVGASDGHEEGDDAKQTVKLEEMLLVHPDGMTQTSEQMREEFINTMLRTKSKAERDAIIATGMLPVSAAIDICATLVWPFGGLLEMDSVWLYSSVQGAKTSRSVTKRLTSTSTTDHDQDTLELNFVPSPRLQVLERFLAAECHKRDPKVFASPGTVPTETEGLEAIGWTPVGGEDKNWEDEAWESQQVKEDLKSVMSKGAKEWDKWCKLFEKKPEKAMKK